MPYTDLTVDQGTNFESTLDLVGDDGAPINVAGYIFTSQVRKSYYSSNATANIIVTVANTINGNLVLTMNSSVTANIMAGRYLYDVKMKDTANVVTRLVEGIITITPQVTKP